LDVKRRCDRINVEIGKPKSETTEIVFESLHELCGQLFIATWKVKD
jgi:hypothetical protein